MYLEYEVGSVGSIGSVGSVGSVCVPLKARNALFLKLKFPTFRKTQYLHYKIPDKLF